MNPLVAKVLGWAWPFILLGLLILGGWQLMRSNEELAVDKGQLEQQVETLQESLQSEAEVADVLADQAQDERKASRQLAADLSALRKTNEQLRSELREIVRTARTAPAGDCLHEPIHPGVGRLLHQSAADRDASPDAQRAGQP